MFGCFKNFPLGLQLKNNCVLEQVRLNLNKKSMARGDLCKHLPSITFFIQQLSYHHNEQVICAAVLSSIKFSLVLCYSLLLGLKLLQSREPPETITGPDLSIIHSLSPALNFFLKDLHSSRKENKIILPAVSTQPQLKCSKFAVFEVLKKEKWREGYSRKKVSQKTMRKTGTRKAHCTHSWYLWGTDVIF